MPAPARPGFVVCPQAGHKSARHYKEERSAPWRLLSDLPVSLAARPCSRICGNLRRWPPPSPDFLKELGVFAAAQSPPYTCRLERRPPPTRAARVQNLDQD